MCDNYITHRSTTLHASSPISIVIFTSSYCISHHRNCMAHQKIFIKIDYGDGYEN